MGLICQGRNQNDVKYVIRLKSPVHVWNIHWKYVNATLNVTDGHRFVSCPSSSMHKRHKSSDDEVCGWWSVYFVHLTVWCNVWQHGLVVLISYVQEHSSVLSSFPCVRETKIH
jgi:hypothetical protein